MENFYKIFNELFNQNGEEKTISTGIRTLDKLIDGGFNSELIVISGRPNHGKTTVLLNLLLNFSFFQEYKGMIVTPRSNPKSFTKRLISIIEDSESPIEDWDESLLVDRLSDLKSLLNQMILVDYNFESLDAILTKAKEWKASYLIIDDFLSIVKYSFLGTKAYLSLIQSLNEFVKQTNIPVFISILAGSSVEKRAGDRRPSIIDVYKSDLLLPSINKVFLVYKEIEYGITMGIDGEPTKEKLELILCQNSRGKNGTLRLNFRKSGRIIDLKLN